MTIKRTIFWMHLIAGVAAGIVIFLLSLSGVLLTYERQIVAALESGIAAPSSSITVDADTLAEKARLLTDGAADGLIFSHNPQAPVYIQAGRSQQGLINPYSGESLGEGTVARAFFRWVTGFHRWFALEGESRGIGKAITGAANLIFLFIIISGLYLWLPRVWKWRAVRMILFFRRGLPSAKARDYNWHNVIGIWCLTPLFFVITTAVVFSYGWANSLVYWAYGEAPPTRSGPASGSNNSPLKTSDTVIRDEDISLQQLLERAKGHTTNWQRITLSLPKPDASSVDFIIDTGNGGEPHKRATLTLDRQNGEVVRVKGFSDNSPGQQARMYIRFLHTGESLGLAGQTLAGLASLGACFLVYTSLALAYRRLLQPLWQKNS